MYPAIAGWRARTKIAFLARLRALRSDLIDPTIAIHNGRVFKRTGDGILIEFRSVVDAVRCAIEVQNGMVERNAGPPPERRDRVFVSVFISAMSSSRRGDGDLMGDGVNIAARLEGVCEPGAICLSEDAYRQVSGRLDMAVADLGPTQLKNIERPIRVYSLQVGIPAQVKPPEAKGRSRLALLAAEITAGILLLAGLAAAGWYEFVRPPAHSAGAHFPAIAVLPFDDLSPDKSLGYLGDGVSEDIIGMLSRFTDLSVTARNSSFVYKGKPVDIRQVGRDLNVDYALEGSVRKEADQIRITAQLIDAKNGEHVWAEHYDKAGNDLSALQDEATEKIVRAITGDLGVIKKAEYHDAWAKDTGEFRKRIRLLSSHPRSYQYRLFERGDRPRRADCRRGANEIS